VGEDQIRDQGSLDLLDTLRDVPGVVISKHNMVGATTGANLYIRGRGYDHPSLGTTTSFDGVPRHGLIYGQSMADGFPVFAAESVEVYKSPQPSSFATGYGLVNVIPKYMAEQGWEARSGFSYGSFQTIGENASFGFRKRRIDIFAAQSWVSTDGHVVNSGARQQSYYLNVGLWLNAYWNLRLLGNFVDAETHKPPQTGQSRADLLPYYATDTIFATATLNNEYDTEDGFVKLYYNNTDFRILDEERGPGGSANGWSKQLLNALGGRARETWHLWEGGELVTGLDLDFSHILNEDHNPPPQPTDCYEFPDMLLFTPYAAASHFFALGKFRVIPSAGLRGYVHSLWANAIAPQAGLELGYGNTNLNLNYSFGVLYPSPGNIQTVVLSGNYDLADFKRSKPETVHHYEASLRHDWRNVGPANFGLGGSWFFDDGHDRIVPNPTGAPGNVSAASYFRIQGLEFSGSFTVERSSTFLEKFSLFAGGAWMYKIEAKGEDGKIVSRMPYTPAFSMSAGFSWQFLKRFRLSGDYQYLKDLYGAGGLGNFAVFTNLSEAYKLDDQHLLNLRLAYEFAYQKWRIERAEVFAAVNNALNHTYQYYVGYEMPGITWSVGFDVTLK
jgi:iron complex outermembrane receptor protein